MALHVIEIQPGVEISADIDIHGSADPRSGLFFYTDIVDALLPRTIRDAVIGGAIAGQHEARELGMLGNVDEVCIDRVTIRGELAPDAMPAALHAAMRAAVLCAAGAPARVVRDGATWTVVRGPP